MVLHMHLSQNKAEKTEIIGIRIMKDDVTADTKHRIWFLSC